MTVSSYLVGCRYNQQDIDIAKYFLTVINGYFRLDGPKKLTILQSYICKQNRIGNYETDISAIEQEKTERPRFPEKDGNQIGAADTVSAPRQRQEKTDCRGQKEKVVCRAIA